MFPYVYDRRRHVSKERVTIREISTLDELQVNIVVSHLDNQMCTYEGENWNEDIDDYSLKLPVRVNNYMYLLWQD